MSQFIDTSKMTDDRAQIVQWHMSQIQIAKEQVDEAQRQFQASKEATERLEKLLRHKDLEKINKEEEDRQLKSQLKEAEDALKTEKYNYEKLKTRKALVNHELEKLDKEYGQIKRKIDQHDDYAIPRLEKQLK